MNSSTALSEMRSFVADPVVIIIIIIIIFPLSSLVERRS